MLKWMSAPILTGVVLSVSTAVEPVGGTPAGGILRATGLRGGLCVVIGGDGRLATDIARARHLLRRCGLYGRASVEPLQPGPLPYADNLVNLLVVRDFPGARARGLTVAETARVLAPGGVAVLEGGMGDLRRIPCSVGLETATPAGSLPGWVLLRKRRPAGMDHWTHRRYDPSGNGVSRDVVVGPLVGPRWQAGPVWPMGTGYQVSNGGMVSAGGRVFFVTLNTLANLHHTPQERNRRWFLVARNAWNGLLLWERPFLRRLERDGQGLAEAVVAAGARLFAVLGERPALLDAATGRTLREYPRKAPPGAMLRLMGDVLVMGGKGLICAFDTTTGKVRWTCPLQVQNLLVADGKVFTSTAGCRALRAFDLRSGRELWRRDLSEVVGGKRQLLLAAAGVVVVVWERDWKRGHNGLAALSAADGRRLWSLEYTSACATWPDSVWVVGGLLWHRVGRDGLLGRDPRTGRERRRITLRGRYSGGCMRNIATVRYLIGTRPLNFFRWSDGACGPFRGGRHSCRAGVIVANGLLYTAPHGCKCVRESLRGFIAFAPRPPGGLRGDTATVLVKGRAWGTPLAPPADESRDWPTWRHDACRSAVTPAALSPSLRTLWRVRLAGDRPDTADPLERDFRAGPLLGDPLTQPVAADGVVLVALPAEHAVAALDAASGRRLWTFTTGAPVDSPPTVYRGLCLFGSHDGWVYCLRVRDGAEVWRLRAAPAGRRILAFGRLESPWPVIGGVMVTGGKAYFVAGRSSAADGGLLGYAVEPTTGRVIWRRRLKAATSDILVREGGAFRIAGGASAGTYFSLATGQPLRTVRADFRWTFSGRLGTLWGGPNRLLDQWWRVLSVNETASYWMRIKQGYGPCEGQLVIGDGRRRRYFAFRFRRVHWSGAKDPATEFGGRLVAWVGREGGKAKETWSVVVPADFQPEAMLLAGERLFVAGPADRFRRRPGGRLWVVSADDGRVLARRALPAPPVGEGMSAARGRLFIATADGCLTCLVGR